MPGPLDDGIAALRERDFARAAVLLREAADADAGDVKARMAMGAALGELGRWDDAVAALREATSLAPGSAPPATRIDAPMVSAHAAPATAAPRPGMRVGPPVLLGDGPAGAQPAPPPVAPAVQRPPARLSYAESKLPSLSAVLIWLVVLGIFG